MVLVALGACVPAVSRIDTQALPDLPLALANNAVASVTSPEGAILVTFLGLEQGKTYRDVTGAAFVLAPGDVRWRPFPAPPGPGRLAATAVAVADTVYLFGGYTVAADGAEKSIETVHAVKLDAGTYRALPPMPVPVDDALSVAWAQRYIYLVSGWHDTGNVNLVQVFDTQTESWFQATPYPGVPVFGHAGGVAGDQIVVCGGVKIVTTTGRRRFAAERACYRGQIDAAQPAKIDWTSLPHHSGPARYRSAAVGVDGSIVFAGGSDNPYNFNGIGYDGRPSWPSDRVHVLDIEALSWRSAARLDVATMDHRGLLAMPDGRFAIVGGMRDDQRVSRAVQTFRLDPP